MVKKKQARFSVSIPYELRENRLLIQPIAWPDQCPCCNEKDGTALGIYKYQYSVSNSQTSTFTPSTYFPLEWEVPYCFKCQKHMKAAENWKAGIAMICLFVPLILTLILISSITSITFLLLMWALFFVGGLVLYKIIVETVVVKSPCLSYDLTFWALSPPTDEHKIIFNFYSDEYAQTFAALNLAELENHAK